MGYGLQLAPEKLQEFILKMTKKCNRSRNRICPTENGQFESIQRKQPRRWRRMVYTQIKLHIEGPTNKKMRSDTTNYAVWDTNVTQLSRNKKKPGSNGQGIQENISPGRQLFSYCISMCSAANHGKDPDRLNS